MKKIAYNMAIAGLGLWIAFCGWQFMVAKDEAFILARGMALDAINAGVSPFGVTPQAVYADILMGICIRLVVGLVVIGIPAIVLRPRKLSI